ncbi:hypothetical protein [Miniphocaeibacter massiliensis]|uniref:hypothetical protein n=1 Tax=Miniphocaeibacter massiliensis TaxID=2041841 RepID=UPI000C1BC03B|nr:hypothetical protein [Miniphocaeibacter massiliensis]
MRCDKLIYLCINGEEVYDETTGDYVTKEPVKYKRYANINDMGDEKMDMLLGKITVGALTIRLNNAFDEDIDYIEYNGENYEIKQRKKLGNKESFQVVKKA